MKSLNSARASTALTSALFLSNIIAIVEDAEHDLIDIYHYFAFHDSPGNAAYVLAQRQSIVCRLPSSPTADVFRPSRIVSGG